MGSWMTDGTRNLENLSTAARVMQAYRSPSNGTCSNAAILAFSGFGARTLSFGRLVWGSKLLRSLVLKPPYRGAVLDDFAVRLTSSLRFVAVQFLT